jgi:hypothetical protein
VTKDLFDLDGDGLDKIVKRADEWMLSSAGMPYVELHGIAFDFARAVIMMRKEVDKFVHALEATTACLKVDPYEVQELIDENTALRERDAEIRKRAETLVETLQSENGFKIDASCCNYCKEMWTTVLGGTREEIAALAREHDKTCTANPVVIERDQLREQLADTQHALWDACHIATTHLPEDRQQILALGKLGRPRP